MEIRIKETSEWVDSLPAEDHDLGVTVTLTHVGGKSVREWWLESTELADVLAQEDGGVVLLTSDGVVFFATVDDVDDSTRGRQALVTFR